LYAASLHRNDFWESPRAIQDLFTRLIHTDGIVPAVGNGQIIDPLLVAAKMNGDGAICVGFRGQIVVAVPAIDKQMTDLVASRFQLSGLENGWLVVSVLFSVKLLSKAYL
jgi:hypothetical protein